jgi:NADH-quinone oxidoreductase subunit J
MLHIIFYAFAVFAVGSAIFVITAPNPVRSVLALVVTFFAMSGIWMLLRAEFLSLILLLVYVGAVMTLFLFVVMMLNIDTESKQSGFVRYLPLGIIIVLLVTGITITAIGPNYFGVTKMPLPQPEMADVSNTQQLGMVLYIQYAYPFEIAGVLLLTAIIAAITLTYRGPVRRRVQSVSDQIAASPATSVRLINMPSEKRGRRP